jgi:hypothetical protein
MTDEKKSTKETTPEQQPPPKGGIKESDMPPAFSMAIKNDKTEKTEK